VLSPEVQEPDLLNIVAVMGGVAVLDGRACCRGSITGVAHFNLHYRRVLETHRSTWRKRLTNRTRVAQTQSNMVKRSSTHILTFVVRLPDAEMGGLGFIPWVGHLGTWDFSWGRSQRNCTLANSKENPGTPLPISLRWLECVDEELSALAVKNLALSPPLPSSRTATVGYSGRAESPPTPQPTQAEVACPVRLQGFPLQALGAGGRLVNESRGGWHEGVGLLVAR